MPTPDFMAEIRCLDAIMKKTITLSVLMLILSVIFVTPAFAYDVEVNGIYYNIDKTYKTAEVSGNSENKYSGNIEIPSSVEVDEVIYSITSIGTSAFMNCQGLKSVVIPNSVTRINGFAFEGCCDLTTITIPNSITSIEYRTFYGCSGLTSVTIPESVTSIGYSAFDGCNSLTSITVPNTIKHIGNNAFRNCI